MTAFGRFESPALAWEVRSVNHRFLEVSFRLPEGLRTLEPSLRDVARRVLGRGKGFALELLLFPTKLCRTGASGAA